MELQHYQVVIVGGGLAGLVCAINLASAGKKVLVIEKHTYPFHKVCGEYISNEVLPYLQSLGFDPFKFGATTITSLRISTPSGKSYRTKLDLGAFGISRYVMDNELVKLAQQNGADILAGTRVKDIQFANDTFTITTSHGDTYSAGIAIGSYGKRDALDKKLKRSFIDRRTRYMGVKYHVRMKYPDDEIGLDNFDGGYCGMSKVEGDKYNVCYLFKRPEKNFRSIEELEEKVLYRNLHLKKILTEAEYLLPHPEVINEISFAPKSPVERHILMCGDTAGLITPLCGNGMSMAIGAAKMLSALIINSNILKQEPISMAERITLEKRYAIQWKKEYSSRLFWGRTIQACFGNRLTTELFIRAVHRIPPLSKWLISRTHGKLLQ